MTIEDFNRYSFTERFRNTLMHWGFSGKVANYTVDFLGLFIVVFSSIIIYYILKFIVNRFLKRLILKSASKWDDYLYENKVFTRLCLIVPVLIINLFLDSLITDYPKAIHFIGTFLELYTATVLILVANSFLNALHSIYGDLEVANSKPIRSYIQILKFIVFVVGGIIVCSMLIGKSPLNLLAGLGALSAVLLLIFKDTILGFVAGVQISSNNMLVIGDWITVPAFNTDGTVIDISLVIVKVKNWDNSISTIPTYSLITGSFMNWRQLIQGGGRRLKRHILLDITSVRRCDAALLHKLEKYAFPELIIGKRREEQTNLGLFRYYLLNHFQGIEELNHEMPVVVKHLQSSDIGLPLEIQAYSLISDPVAFENFQSEMFEHVFSVVKDFDLKIYQKGPRTLD